MTDTAGPLDPSMRVGKFFPALIFLLLWGLRGDIASPRNGALRRPAAAHGRSARPDDCEPPTVPDPERTTIKDVSASRDFPAAASRQIVCNLRAISPLVAGSVIRDSQFGEKKRHSLSISAELNHYSDLNECRTVTLYSLNANRKDKFRE